MYAYVGNDPLNKRDPRGTDIVVIGNPGGGGFGFGFFDFFFMPTFYVPSFNFGGLGDLGNLAGLGTGTTSGEASETSPEEIVVEANRQTEPSQSFSEVIASQSDVGEIIVNGIRTPDETELAELDIDPRRSLPFEAWWRAEGKGMADYVKQRYDDCMAGDIDAGTLARDTAKGGATGAVKGAAKSWLWGAIFGPEGAAGTATLGAAKGAATGSISGAAKSALKQKCGVQ